MSVFWILIASLVLLALGLLLPSLLKTRRAAGAVATDIAAPVDAGHANLVILREQIAQIDAELAAGSITQAQHAQTRGEIERRALEENTSAEMSAERSAERSAELSSQSSTPGAVPPQRTVSTRATRTAVLVGLSVPLLALGLYGFLGTPQAVLGVGEAGVAGSEAGGAPGGEVTQAQVEAMVAQLAQRLENAPANQPGDPKGWEMLARTYAAMQRFPEADKAYTRATALAPDDAQLLADHADVLAVLQGQSAIGAPEKLIARALKIDPKNPKALALAGSVAYERKDFAAATNYWTQARQLAPADSEFAKGLDSSLDAAASAASASASTSSASATATTSAAAASTNISGVVSLSPALAAKVAPDDTVFIFARAAEGPRMPLAILRRKASELPISFTLDDSTAMSPEMKLSKFAQVVVGARISKSGNAMPQPGDLVGQAGSLSPPADKLGIMIDGVQQ
jgi:cytochrome c-type biogenesis protein CcmH